MGETRRQATREDLRGDRRGDQPDDLLLPGAVRRGGCDARAPIPGRLPRLAQDRPRSETLAEVQVPLRLPIHAEDASPHRGPGAFIRRTAFERAGMRDPEFRYVADS